MTRADKEVPTDKEIEVQIFTDGACSGNPGPGGWAFVMRHLPSKKEKEDAGGEPETTNNRMELMAVIKGLEALKRPCLVEIFTDSEYVRRGLLDWMAKWKANGWQRKEGNKFKPVKNVEIWQRLDELIQLHDVTYTRVAGHSGHPENDRCDELAVGAYQRYL